MTIHSYCHMLLERFPIEAELNKEINIINEAHKQLLLNQVKGKLVQNIFKNNSPEKTAIQNILKEISTDSFEILINALVNIRNDFIAVLANYSKENQLIEIKNAIRRKLNLKEKDTYKTIYKNYFSNIFKREIFTEIITILNNLESVTGRNSQLKIDINEFIKEYSKEYRNYNNLLATLKNIFLTKDNKPRKQILTKSIKDLLGNKAETITTTLYLYQTELLDLLEKINNLRTIEVTMNLYEIFIPLLDNYSQLKKYHGYDYDDLINKSIELLENSESKEWILYNINNEIDHILLDEAQDTSHLQWKLINLITENFFSDKDIHKTIFVVGDDKQSIFQFQGAKHHLFNYQYQYYQKKITNSNYPYPLKFINLNKSFRTGGIILKFIDNIFNHNKIRSKITYSENIIHLTARNKNIGEYKIISIKPIKKKPRKL